MRVRESGMPDEKLWRSFFDPPFILRKLGLQKQCQHIVEFGCGFGTFTIPAAQMIEGKITAIEIDSTMLSATREAAELAELTNVNLLSADFCAQQLPIAENSVDYVMLFNILHGEQPQQLIAEAYRLLKPEACGGLIHWNYDPETPRGPPMEIRPKPTELASIVATAGFHVSELIDLPPFHYGYQFSKQPLN